MSPRVSVVVTSYNYGRFLGEAIESVLAQTEKDVEIIVVDDGSTDDSVAVARRYPVRVLVQSNGGVSSARNRGASVARGAYLMFLDADDQLDPTYLARCVAALDRQDRRVAYAYTGMELFGTESGTFEAPAFDAQRLCAGNYVHASALMRRDVFDEVGGFDVSLRLGYEDYELWLRMLEQGYVGVCVPAPLLRYRRHGTSRNTLSTDQLALLRRRLMRAHPRLYWRELAANPARALRAWVEDRGKVEAPPRRAPPPREADPVDISVVIVNWNSRKDLADCLRSLEAQTDRDFEVVVVDNGSVDGSVEMLARDFPWVVALPTGENLGFAEGCNRGIEAARGSWIATLNNDAIADPRWIAEQRAAVRAGGPRLGMIQSKILFLQARHRTNSTGVLLFPNASAVDRDYDEKDRPAAAGAPEPFCPSAGAALYRRAMLDEVRLPSGFFDRTFFMYFEDVDLGWRCRLAGWEAIYLPEAVVLHAFHGSSKRKGRSFVEMHCRRNRVRMALKNASPLMLARTLPNVVEDVFWAMGIDGPAAAREFARAARDGVRQRRAVERRSRVARGAVERRWVVRSKR